jgi:hypothetical protein
MESRPARVLLQMQKSRGTAGAAISVFHLMGYPIHTRLEICSLGSLCPVQNLEPPEDFHAAIGGRKDSQTNWKVDQDVDARFIARAVIQISKYFHPPKTRLCLYPKRSERSVKLSMLWRSRAAIVASGEQIAIISLAMYYQLSALMSKL